MDVQYQRNTLSTKAARLFQPIIWSMAAISCDSVVAAVVRSAHEQTASHNNQEKINSWVSFMYGAQSAWLEIRFNISESAVHFGWKQIDCGTYSVWNGYLPIMQKVLYYVTWFLYLF